MKEGIFLCTTLEVEVPISYQEVIYSPTYNEWMQAMRDEMASMARLRFENSLIHHRPDVSLLRGFKITRWVGGLIDELRPYYS